MSTDLFTVTLTDLATYDITVAAGTEKEAQSIAEQVLLDEMMTLPPGSRIVERQTDAKAVVAAKQPVRRFRVSGRYELNFWLNVPATDSTEAVRHARRLYSEACGPFEFEQDGGDCTRMVAEEVMS